jgi:two-component system, cell cycle response regulator DivK
MAGEPILIVDDTPVNLKLTRILLVNEGYKVLTAASAEEALEVLRDFRPSLILTDIQLPGIDGLELTRRLKSEESTRNITVVALTAFATAGDEKKALEAGCDGYITKPIDTRSLGARIREFLDRRGDAVEPGGGGTPSNFAPLPATEMYALRRRFLSEGLDRVRRMLIDMDGRFIPEDASKIIHQWVGTGGLLGYSAISRLAREAETLLSERPLENSQLREALTRLALAFTTPKEARDDSPDAAVAQALGGKRVGLVGLPAGQARQLTEALERVRASATPLDRVDAPEAAGCAALVASVSSVVSREAPERRGGVPLTLVGSREELLALPPWIQALASEYLMDSWQPEEALVRLTLALSRPLEARLDRGRPQAGAAVSSRPRVLVADDDSAVVELLRTAIENFGMECISAGTGTAALEAIRLRKPAATVLDVNMPGMDGYAVLAAIRQENLPTMVLLLTARQQEQDVIRGFALGADDYVVKPFSPMELVARLKRLLRR